MHVASALEWGFAYATGWCAFGAANAHEQGEKRMTRIYALFGISAFLLSTIFGRAL